jgi:hypothetical protein
MPAAFANGAAVFGLSAGAHWTILLPSERAVCYYPIKLFPQRQLP